MQKPEHEKAREWREASGLSRRELAELIGFSPSAIQDYEAGEIRGTGKPIGADAWKRYRLACGAVALGATGFCWVETCSV